MKHTKSVIFGLLLTSMLLSSCAKDPAVTPTETNAAPAGTEAETEAVTEPGWHLTLPEVDMEGYNFRVLTLNTGAVALTTVFQPDEETGEILNDAIYKRNQKIAERYNVNFSQQGVDDYFTPSSMLRKSVSADSDDFDLYYLVQREAFGLILDGYGLRPDELPYIDPTQPWYFHDMNEQLKINGLSVMVYGADSITSYDNSAIMLFNKALFGREDLGDPYDMVRDGTWTIDKFFSIAKSVVRDLNGDGKINDYDQLGVVSENDFVYTSLLICAEHPFVANVNNTPTFMPGSDDVMMSLMMKIADYRNSDGIIFDVFYDKCEQFAGYQEVSEAGRAVSDMIFSSGNTAMRITSIAAMNNLRNMEDDFGVIPMPKLDETQKKYRTRAIGGLYGTVPSTTQNAENISIILEALAAESYYNLIPAYCETILKDKYSRDTDSAEMLDLILSSMYQDLSDAIWVEARSSFLPLFEAGKNSFASESEKVGKKIQKQIEQYLKKVEKITDDLG